MKKTDGIVVICRLCGTERLRLGAHLRAEHYLTTQEYQRKFPGEPVEIPGSRQKSPECRQKMAVAARKRWENQEERRAQSERLKAAAPWKGRRLSAEHREAISDGGRGVSHNLTEERRAELRAQRLKMLAKIHADPEYGKKQSARMRKRALQDQNLGFRQPAARAKSLASRIQNGTLIPAKGGRGIAGFRSGIPHYCRSTLEANFARVLIHEGIEYEYEPRVFKLASGRWTPDFRLRSALRDLVPAGWVELKGFLQNGQPPGRSGVKIADFERMTGEKVFVLSQSSDLWDKIVRMYSGLLSWEYGHHNLKTHPADFGRADFLGT